MHNDQHSRNDLVGFGMHSNQHSINDLLTRVMHNDQYSINDLVRLGNLSGARTTHEHIKLYIFLPRAAIQTV
jgi:hypothetical protein